MELGPGLHGSPSSTPPSKKSYNWTSKSTALVAAAAVVAGAVVGAVVGPSVVDVLSTAIVVGGWGSVAGCPPQAATSMTNAASLFIAPAFRCRCFRVPFAIGT